MENEPQFRSSLHIYLWHFKLFFLRKKIWASFWSHIVNFLSFQISDGKNANGKTIDLAMIPNLNWLIHMAFARQDYKYCNEVIEYQFSETYDHEYLYYIKVSICTYRYWCWVPFNRQLWRGVLRWILDMCVLATVCDVPNLSISQPLSDFRHIIYRIQSVFFFLFCLFASFLSHFYVSMV